MHANNYLMENIKEIEDVGNFYTKVGFNQLFIDVNAEKYGLWKISIYDINGNMISSEAKFLIKGNNILPIYNNTYTPITVKFESGSLSEQRIYSIN